MAVPEKDCPWSCHSDGSHKEALRENFFPALFGGEKINANFWKILGHSVKRGGLVIQDPWSSVETAYNTSKAYSGEMVGCLLGVIALNYVVHGYFVRGASMGARKERQHVEIAYMDRQKDLVGGQERNHLHRSTRNWVCLSSIPDCLNVMELSQEELWDNLRLRYGMMPQDISAT